MSTTKKAAGGFGVVKNIGTKFMDDNCLILSAAIAYYALQSLIPLILGFISVAGLLLQDAGSRADFIKSVNSAIPAEISNTIKLSDLLEGLSQGAAAAGIISIAALLWTGSGIFEQLMFGVNLAYGVRKDKRKFFVKLGVRLAMLFGLGGLLVAAFAITFIFNLIINADVELFGISPKNFSFVLPLVAYLLPLLLEVAMFMLLYRFGSSRKDVRWKPTIIGGIVAAILFELLKIAFTFYVTAFGAASNAAKTYGAIGGIIVFLFFLYLLAAVTLFGAEVSAGLHRFEDSQPEAPKGTPGSDEPEKKAERELAGVGTVNAQIRLSMRSRPATGFFSRRAVPATQGPTNLLAVFTGGLVLLVVALANLGSGHRDK
jgi:membrane protein